VTVSWSRKQNSMLITCKDITKVYVTGETETHALRDVDCTIRAGEFVAIMGPSGSGKSTFMQILGLLDRPTSGTYVLDGTDTATFDDDALSRLRNRRFGFIFQSFNLLPRTTVADNVALPLLYNRDERLSAAQSHERVMAALAAVSMEHRATHTTNQLSGGEQQRTAIARALINNPDVLFADEPTGNLDSKTGLQVMRILQRLHEDGKTIVLVTHEATTARHAERMLSMVDGRIVDDAPVADRINARDEDSLRK